MVLKHCLAMPSACSNSSPMNPMCPQNKAQGLDAGNQDLSQSCSRFSVLEIPKTPPLNQSAVTVLSMLQFLYHFHSHDFISSKNLSMRIRDSSRTLNPSLTKSLVPLSIVPINYVGEIINFSFMCYLALSIYNSILFNDHNLKRRKKIATCFPAHKFL